MKIFGWEIKKDIPGTVNIAMKDMDALLNRDPFTGAKVDFKSTRPRLDPYTDGHGGDETRKRSIPIGLPRLYEIAILSDTLRTINKALQREIFRNGYEIKEVFARKCKDCDKEFDNDMKQCDDCGGTNLRKPDIQQKIKLTEFLREVNDNEQNILELGMMLEKDLEIADDLFLLAIKDYYVDEKGALIGNVVVELIRADPKTFEIIADERGIPGLDEAGQEVKVCPIHRTKSERGNYSHCGTCGIELQLAYYRSYNEMNEYMYYLKDEICHVSKYDPSLTYGTSPIISVWTKVVTLINMDTYMMNYYGKARPPSGLMAIKTANQDSVEKAWAWMLDEWKKNPHQIPPLIVEDPMGSSKGNFIEFIDFMKSMEEMQYTPAREEFRRTIGAVYSVMPIFQGDVGGSGGLNNEGLQITVTSRGITDGQRPWNEKVYPWITKQLYVTDYKLLLVHNEQQDDTSDEELWAKKVDTAKKMQEMGFDVTLNEDKDFEYDPIDEPVSAPEPTGGFGGLGDGSAAVPPEGGPEVATRAGTPDMTTGETEGTPAKPDLATRGG